jgi:hypothetical protein
MTNRITSAGKGSEFMISCLLLVIVSVFTG